MSLNVQVLSLTEEVERLNKRLDKTLIVLDKAMGVIAELTKEDDELFNYIADVRTEMREDENYPN